MHAKHADNSEENDLSRHMSAVQQWGAKEHYEDIVVGVYFVWRAATGVQARGPGPMNRTASSACSACIGFLICAWILAWAAAPGGW